MARREVKCVLKFEDGDIMAIGNSDYNVDWSPRFKSDAIDDIESNRHTYYVNYNGNIVDIEVVDGRYLRTDPDDTTKNNLDSLPIC